MGHLAQGWRTRGPAGAADKSPFLAQNLVANAQNEVGRSVSLAFEAENIHKVHGSFLVSVDVLLTLTKREKIEGNMLSLLTLPAVELTEESTRGLSTIAPSSLISSTFLLLKSCNGKWMKL